MSVSYGAVHTFNSDIYPSDVVSFQAVDLDDTAGLSITVAEGDHPTAEVTLTLYQLGEFAHAMYAALEQAAAIAADKHTSRLLGLLRSGIAENPFKAEDGA